MLHIQFIGITKCSNMVANILPAYPLFTLGVKRSIFNFFRTWSCCLSNLLESRKVATWYTVISFLFVVLSKLLPCGAVDDLMHYCIFCDSNKFDMQHDHVLKEMNFDRLTPTVRGGLQGKIFANHVATFRDSNKFSLKCVLCVSHKAEKLQSIFIAS